MFTPEDVAAPVSFFLGPNCLYIQELSVVSPSRKRKPTRFNLKVELPAVERYLNGMNKENVPNAIRAVHTYTVSEALGTYTGPTRVTFAQLRSEFPQVPKQLPGPS